MKKHSVVLILLGGIFIVVGGLCMGKSVNDDLGLDKVFSEKWDKLAEQGIFFGHQSVGENVMDGMVAFLEKTRGININLREVVSGRDIRPAQFSHARVGKNQSPQSKMADFSRFIDEGASCINLAFLKFCYVDVDRNTPVKQLFQEYRKTMETLEKKYPHIIFVHFTLPLKTPNASWRTRLKSFLGRKSWEYSDNIQRNEYNRVLLKAFENQAPVFDVALFEAMAGDGKLSTFREQGKDYLALQEAYSHDGGHLNAAGRQWIATHLLVFLAELHP
ncbi:MAG: SGNH/GDSL hydrolase family protein [Desulfobacterium sp.]